METPHCTMLPWGPGITLCFGAMAARETHLCLQNKANKQGVGNTRMAMQTHSQHVRADTHLLLFVVSFDPRIFFLVNVPLFAVRLLKTKEKS